MRLETTNSRTNTAKCSTIHDGQILVFAHSRALSIVFYNCSGSVQIRVISAIRSQKFFRLRSTLDSQCWRFDVANAASAVNRYICIKRLLAILHVDSKPVEWAMWLAQKALGLSDASTELMVGSASRFIG